MEKFFQRIPRTKQPSNETSDLNIIQESSKNARSDEIIEEFSKKARSDDIIQEPSKEARFEKALLKFDPENLISDPGLRPKLFDYNPNDLDRIRRAYIDKGPCQPRNHKFPFRTFGNISRRFIPSWFDSHKNWLEYSIAKDKAYCLCCYLFKHDHGEQGGGNIFASEGFSNWKDSSRFSKHVGIHDSAHNVAVRKCQVLMDQKQHIDVAVKNQREERRIAYRIRLEASLDCIRFLLRQGLPFRGHDESEESNNKGNFLELLEFLTSHDESVRRVALENAPENLKLTSPRIQKDIVNAAATETTRSILKDLGNDLFSILIDESRDVSIKEQMAIVLRYVNEKGHVIERFLAIVHVTDTTALSLKKAIDSLFSKHGLSISSLRGQGYDGASNMRGEFGGLKTLLMKENKQAFYIHCFAHQLQLALVAVAQGNAHVAFLFNLMTKVINVVGGSCKRRDTLRAKEVERVAKDLERGAIISGRGLNQEAEIKRAGETRWGSHYGAILNLIYMFSSVIDVLVTITKDGSSSEQRGDALGLLNALQTFEFAFLLHLMKLILGRTNELSQALQRKDQDIINAMALVRISKQQLQSLRNDGWESFMQEVNSFCGKHNVEIPNMDGKFIAPGRSRRDAQETTNMHHFQIEIFNNVIDWQLNELNDRFNEANTELLLCVASLDPSNSFATFDKQKLIRLAHFYPSDFSAIQIMVLDSQLDTYILDVRSNGVFSQVHGIGGLSKKLVELKKDQVYPLVFLLIKLVLLLPVATATVERAFSAMNIVKSRLRNRMGDDWMNDCLVTYIEKDVFDTIDNERIMMRFQNMANRREML